MPRAGPSIRDSQAIQLHKLISVDKKLQVLEVHLNSMLNRISGGATLNQKNLVTQILNDITEMRQTIAGSPPSCP